MKRPAPWHRPCPLPGTGAFARHTAEHPPRPAEPNAAQITSAYVGRHCAGMEDRAGAEEVLSALRTPQAATARADATIGWLIGSIEVAECMRLMARCAVPAESLAHYARMNGGRRKDLNRFLRQFAIEETP